MVIRLGLSLVGLLLVSACGGGGGGTAPPGQGVNTYTVQGTLTGLIDDGLVLQLNGSDNLAVAANSSSFEFSTAVPDGNDYMVTVLNQPARANARITCSVNDGSDTGTIEGANITNVNFICKTAYTISVTVSSYDTGNDMLLQNNSGDDLIVSTNGVYTFSVGLEDGSPYSVSINTPSVELKTSCTLANNIGDINGANITNVQVFCSDNISPSLASTTPLDGATGVALDTVVSAQFDEDMLASSLMTDPLNLSDVVGSITGLSNYDALTRTVSLTLDSPLALLSEYTVDLSSGISDLAGRRLRNNDRSWSFTSRDGIWAGTSLLEVNNDGNAELPQIALDQAGNGLAVWAQSDGTYKNIWANRYDVTTGSWGDAEPIDTENLGHAESVQVAMDPSGNGIAVWQQDNGSRKKIWANHYDAETNTWGMALVIDSVDASATVPQIVMDASGNGTAVWTQFSAGGFPVNLHARRYDAQSASWGTEELLEFDNAQFHLAYEPQIAIDAAGNVIAVWLQSGDERRSTWANRYDVSADAWSGPQLIETNDIFGTNYDVRVAMDPMGNGIAIWTQSDGTNYRLWYNRYTFNVVDQTGSWDAIAGKCNANISGYVPNRTQIAMDSAGNAQIIWDEYDNANTISNVWTNRYRISDKTWSGAALIETSDLGHASFPDIALDPAGNGIAVWNQSNGTQISVLSRRYDVNTNTWADEPELLEDDETGKAVSVKIGLDPKGRGIAVWTQRVGTLDNIWANRFE